MHYIIFIGIPTNIYNIYKYNGALPAVEHCQVVVYSITLCIVIEDAFNDLTKI